MSMHLCTSCTQRNAQQYCRCSEPPVKLCEECVGKHQYSDRMRSHEQLPIETFPYCHIPGYVEAYKMRTGRQKTEAIGELQGNLALLRRWKDELKTTHDSIHEMVSEHWKQQEQELTAFHSSLEAAIQAGIQEFDSTFIEPNPELKTAIAKGIRQFQPGIFRLLSACTDLEAYEQQVRELISESVFEVEMKQLLPDIVPLVDEGSVFRVVSNVKPGAEMRKSTKEENTSTISKSWLASSGRKKKSISVIWLISAFICLGGVDISSSPTANPWEKDSDLYGKAGCTQVYRAQAYCVSTLGFTYENDLSTIADRNFTFDDAVMEVADYLRTEEEWLNREKVILAGEIRRQEKAYVHQIRCYGEQKRQELDQIVQGLVDSLELFNSTEHYEHVLYLKRKGEHLQKLNFEFNEMETDNLLDLSRRTGRYRLVSRTSPDQFLWSFNGPFDAITFSASRSIELTGVSLTKGEWEGGLVLHSLELLKGNTTSSEVLYSDTEKRYMDSDHPFQVDVRLKKSVRIAPNTQYTIKVLMLGCKGMYSLMLQPTEQDGLVVTPSNTIFNGKEKDNMSSVKGGIFKELHYLT